MYSQRDSLQIELEKIENEKRLNFQRYQIEQQRINNNLELETAKIYYQATCGFMQNIIPNQCVMQKRTYMQQPQNYQTQYVNAYPNGLTNLVQYKEHNDYQDDDYDSQNKSFQTQNSQADEYVKMIYEHAKNTVEQLSAKEFLTPEEHYYYSELKDAVDFIDAGQTLRNPNNSFVSKLDAAKKAADILNKHLHIY